MNEPLSFFIEGVPAPGGSKTFFPLWRRDGSLVTEMRNGRPWPIIRVTDAAGEGNKRWKKNCAMFAKFFMKSSPPFEVAVKVELIFYIVRPKNHYRTGKFSHMLRDDAPRQHIIRPDALKFARSTEDALTGIVWHDDAGNVRICSEKRYKKPDEREGCAVRIVLIP